MSCHVSGGSGKGWFTTAGTVYDSTQTSVYPNSTVKFYSGSNATGSLIAIIQVDQLGNFYTTENINYGDGLYVAVEGSEASINMISKVTSGQCNSCHGGSTDRIWTK